MFKENFIKNKFDLATSESVEAIQKLYNIAKNSDVMQSIIVDLVPKMSSKWISGEKFLGMDIPVSGDMKEVMLDVLKVFNTSEFNVLNKNINVLLDVIRVANNHNIVDAVNRGDNILDVIDNGTFVKDEINTLSESSEFRRVLPNILTTTIKLAYKSVLDEPGDKLNQEFTQTQLAEIVWTEEANVAQKIVSNMFGFFETEDLVDCLDDFGAVIDDARNSKILSKPVWVLMKDYIDVKAGLSDEVEPIIMDALSEENWKSSSYSYTNLFKTVQVTAKVAKDLEEIKFTDIPLEELLENDDEGLVQETIENVINAGLLTDLVGDETKAKVYEDMILTVLDKSSGENPVSIPTELRAGQVVVDIINKSNESSSMFGDDKNIEASTAVTSLSESKAVMEVLATEAEKVEIGQDSTVKTYIDNMNEADRIAFENAIKAMDEGVSQDTLAILFGITLD